MDTEVTEIHIFLTMRIKFEKGIPRQREPYKHSNRGIMDGPQHYNNLKLQQYKDPLLNA